MEVAVGAMVVAVVVEEGTCRPSCSEGGGADGVRRLGAARRGGVAAAVAAHMPPLPIFLFFFIVFCMVVCMSLNCSSSSIT